MQDNQSPEKPSRKIPYNKENRSSEKRKPTFIRLGCLIVFGVFLFLAFHFSLYFPGYFAHRNRSRRQSVAFFVEKAVLALEDYSQKSPGNLYPKRKDLKETIDKNLESHANSLKKFYGRASSVNRKRGSLSIDKIGRYWKVLSG